MPQWGEGPNTSLSTRIEDDIGPTSRALTTRAVIVGVNDNGITYTNAQVDETGNLHTEIRSPTSAFGELLATHTTPRVQIDAIYGLLVGTDHEIFTSAGGSATAANALFTCGTGTGVGAYGVVRSRRLVRYRPGQGSRARFTAAFTAGVPNSQQGAGLFTATDGFFVGFTGTQFGITRRIAGACAIYRLTITSGASGAENMTVTLAGTAVVVASGGALSASATAERIARFGVFSGWSSAVSPTSNGATVTFIQRVPGTTSGAFSFASSGGAAGAFAAVQVGAANDDTTGFVAQADWNVDKMNGTGPSGVTLDPTKLNVYEVVVPYLGAGTIIWRVMEPSGHFATVHRIEYPNAAAVPSQRNPTYRVGWFAASLGSTTNLVVTGASAAAFVDGEPTTARDPFSTSNLSFSASATEYVALALRVRGEFSGTVNQREIFIQTGVCATETAARVVRVRWILNPTLTGAVDWNYIDQSLSAVERATPTNITPSGGREVATDIVASGAASRIDLAKLDLRLEPGDVLVAALQTTSGTATAAISVNWQEK